MSSIDIYAILSSKPHNQHYLNRYWKFIQSLQHQTGIHGKTEYHHICPKSSDLFPQYSSIKDNPWNGIHLTYRQHFLAHWMLSNAYKGKQIYAFIMLCRINIKHERIRFSSRLYEQLSAKHIIGMTGDKNPFYGRKHSQETIDKLKFYRGVNHHAYGIPLTDDVKIRHGDSRAKVWFNITTPDGTLCTIRNLNKFCREHNLHASAMIKVAQNLQKNHKGYICKYA